jgi:hypothetical protein
MTTTPNLTTKLTQGTLRPASPIPVSQKHPESSVPALGKFSPSRGYCVLRTRNQLPTDLEQTLHKGPFPMQLVNLSEVSLKT